MRRWIDEGIAVCLIALLVQVFAPVGSAWAMAAVADPLTAPICSHDNALGKTHQTPAPAEDGGSCCALCAFVHAGCAPLPALPLPVALQRQPIRRVVRHPPAERVEPRLFARDVQARGPPASS